jgi:ribonucleoside-diphosphate reductase alpha chain
MSEFYENLSKSRKLAQENGGYPDWYTTGGYNLFQQKYLYDAKDFKQQAKRIAKTAASNLPEKHAKTFEKKFFNLIWDGHLSCSTPVLANTGTDRGMPVSCEGGYVEDSINGFYQSLHEHAVLTKNGFGTSVYLGDIRPRGVKISGGGTASGVMPVLEDFVLMSRKVSQGGVRRGAVASYLPVEHGDFWEVIEFLEQEPDDLNLGWVISEDFIAKLEAKEEEATKRFQRMMKVKMVTGRGYFFFVDKANANRPASYRRHRLDIKASNLCSEIMLHSSKDYSFTCVLSSMNLARWDEWKDTDAVFTATVFLDCIAAEFIKKSKGVEGLEKARRFTRKGRALGLGVCGFHTYLQQKMIPFESLEAHYFNTNVFKHMDEESKRASEWLAKELGEPDWCKGLGIRNTHRLAIAPTKSTALLMGGVSEGINPDPAMTYTQASAGGEVERINPILLGLMKSKGINDKKHIQEVIDARGSVQGVDWLTQEEKDVFKTAFEINQEVVVRLASNRQRFIDQGQSLNLFFSAEEDEAWIAKIHQMAFKDPMILALYYCYSKSGVVASKDCEACS